ncbi:hypothetical protein L2U69_14945 [Zavarzinia compransoris]|uniref:hypothetical protein n=1 Tax=Zavarzinia marina TaxID=2911065 RepID=UPI001F2E557F|nr:hypothetical protein [Zavarzinia marina]MCF4166948.1 hypothetical protein [Zavarzinia marina]
MTVPDHALPEIAPGEGLDRWRGLIRARERRERWNRRLTAGVVAAIWGAYGLGFFMTVTADSGFGAFFGAAGLMVALMPAMLLSLGILLARGWLARRAGLALLGPRHGPARMAFEPQWPVVAAAVADMDRLDFEPDERRQAGNRLDQLAGIFIALRHLGPESDRLHAQRLAQGVAPLVRDLADVRRRALSRTISGSLPPGGAPGFLAGGEVPRPVAPAVEKLEAALALAGRSDRPATVAAARRAQDSAGRALAALRADTALAPRTRDLIEALTAEVAAELARDGAGRDPTTALEIEERLMRARKGDA